MIGVLCVLAVVLPALLALSAGSFSLPSIDDWAYRRVAETFAQSATVRFSGYVAMTLIGQVLWSWPFLRLLGGGAWGFAASTAVLAVVGIASAYYIGRSILSRVWAAGAVLVLILAPGFAGNTSTFMTDVPTTSCELVCVALGLAAIRRRGRSRAGLLAASLAAGVFGFAVREFAVVAPLSVLFCAAIGAERRDRAKYLLAGLVELLVCAAIYLWWLRQPGGVHQPLLLPSTITLVRLVQGYFTLAFMVSPAVAAVLWRRRRAPVAPRAALSAVLVLLLGLAADANAGSVFVGDFLARRGAVGTLLLDGSRPALFPQALWDLISVVGLVAGATLAGLALGGDRDRVREWRTWDWAGPLGLVRIFVIFFGAGSVVYLLATTFLWDRYLWPLAFFVVLLLLGGGPRGVPARRWAKRVGRGVAALLWVLLGLVAASVTLNTDAYDAGRWRAGELAVARGVPAREVDAGFEWVGAHSRTIANLALDPRVPGFEAWYARIQPGFRECAVVSGSRLASRALRPIGVARYRLWSFAGPSEPLFVYRVAGCKAPPAVSAPATGAAGPRATGMPREPERR